MDQWFEHDVKPRLRGRAFEVRYADDAVLVFEHEDDAQRVLGVLAKRLEKYGHRTDQGGRMSAQAFRRNATASQPVDVGDTP